MYSYKERKTAVKLYIKYGRRAARVIKELGYPNRLTLRLWFYEFQRSTYFYAMGSVRDIFDFNLMQEVPIPLPPKEVQQKIVDLYNCYERCKRIANEAREK